MTGPAEQSPEFAKAVEEARKLRDATNEELLEVRLAAVISFSSCFPPTPHSSDSSLRVPFSSVRFSIPYTVLWNRFMNFETKIFFINFSTLFKLVFLYMYNSFFRERR